MKILLFVLAACVAYTVGQVKRPRGVSISKTALYKEGLEFTCFDGSQTIAFDRINDDYCDCSDGSDEPGTSACPNGSFHCTNAGHKPRYIPSSRVNDGICDCCDGTDEYDNRKECANYCKELGKQMREEMEKKRALLLEGFEIYKDYVSQGSAARKENQDKLEDLRTLRDDLRSRKDDLEAKKKEVEAPEKDAKDKHRNEWEEKKAQWREEKNKQTAQEAFSDLDTDSNNMVSVEEMQSRIEFDIDNSGEVSPEEAREYLEDHQEVDFEVFFDKIWENIKEIYKKSGSEQGQALEPETTPEPARDLSEEHFDDAPEIYDDEDEEYEEEEEDLDHMHRNFPRGDLGEEFDNEYIADYDRKYDPSLEDKTVDDDDDFKIPEYDEDVKQLIEVAEQARKEYDEADSEFRKVDRELSDTESMLGIDFGPNNEFFPLKGNCYEYSDNQYTYKLCPFDKATQRSKHGGAETSLGRWGKFEGPESDKYSMMRYEKGQNCYNGPDRSCNVRIECGVHNELKSSAEPNRCEYEYVFATPAACGEPPSPEALDAQHDEL